jgi:hypothetical protein
MTATAAPRPDWRTVNVSLLAEKLYAAYHESQFHDVPLQLSVTSSITVADWERVAEAAVDELIDRPEREFQAQVDKVLATEWQPATAGDWLPEHA